MKRLLALLVCGSVCVGRGALLPPRGPAPQAGTRQINFLARRNAEHNSGIQPWLYNPPPAVLPRAKPLEIPGDPLFLPPVDKLWDMQPSASPPTIEPPEKQGDVGLQATVPPKSLEGWYATISPQAIAQGLVDNRTAYYVRCLGGPPPCPMTVPPTVLRYWVPVSSEALRIAESSTTLSENTLYGSMVLPVTSNVGFAVGRLIIIDAGTKIEEVNYVVGFGSLILQMPCKYAHTKGALITMPPAGYTTPPPGGFRPWNSFNPFSLWGAPGGAPGPAPFGLAPAPAPAR